MRSQLHRQPYVSDGYNRTNAVRRGQVAARYTGPLQGTTSHLITLQQLDAFFARAEL